MKKKLKYISTLNDEIVVVVSLQNEVEELNEKCRPYEILQSTNDDFIYGLFVSKAQIPLVISYIERSSNTRNCTSSVFFIKKAKLSPVILASHSTTMKSQAIEEIQKDTT